MDKTIWRLKLAQSVFKLRPVLGTKCLEAAEIAGLSWFSLQQPRGINLSQMPTVIHPLMQNSNYFDFAHVLAAENDVLAE